MKLLFQLVMDDDLKRFESEIKELADMGWKPYGTRWEQHQDTTPVQTFVETGAGGVPTDKVVYFQAMMK
jgi:hypothetical protein